MSDVKSGLHMKSYAVVIWWNFLAVRAMRRFAANDESRPTIYLSQLGAEITATRALD